MPKRIILQHFSACVNMQNRWLLRQLRIASFIKKCTWMFIVCKLSQLLILTQLLYSRSVVLLEVRHLGCATIRLQCTSRGQMRSKERDNEEWQRILLDSDQWAHKNNGFLAVCQAVNVTEQQQWRQFQWSCGCATMAPPCSMSASARGARLGWVETRLGFAHAGGLKKKKGAQVGVHFISTLEALKTFSKRGIPPFGTCPFSRKSCLDSFFGVKFVDHGGPKRRPFSRRASFRVSVRVDHYRMPYS